MKTFIDEKLQVQKCYFTCKKNAMSCEVTIIIMCCPSDTFRLITVTVNYIIRYHNHPHWLLAKSCS